MRTVGGMKNDEKPERIQGSNSMGLNQETLVVRNCQFCLELELQYGRCCDDCCGKPLNIVVWTAHVVIAFGRDSLTIS